MSWLNHVFECQFKEGAVMKKISRIGSLVIFTAGISLISFAVESRTPDADEVIARSRNFYNPAEKQIFLDSKAQTYFLQKDYRNAKEIAEYTIYNINGESQTANNILTLYREKFEKGS